MNRNFGHAPVVPAERPDSVNDPLGEKMTPFARVILAVAIVAGLVLGWSVANGYYVWLLK